jgi:hypothetical protein
VKLYGVHGHSLPYAYGYDVRFMPWGDDNLVEWKKAAENQWQNKTSIKVFQLPTFNKYIATDFKIIVSDVEKELNNPNLVRDDKLAKLWWKLDDKFQARISWGIHGLPKVSPGRAMPYHSTP